MCCFFVWRWEMRNETWDVRNGRWEMRDERWEMRDERWEMRNEKWEMRNERNILIALSLIVLRNASKLSKNYFIMGCEIVRREKWEMRGEKCEMRDERWEMRDEKDERWEMRDDTCTLRLDMTGGAAVRLKYIVLPVVSTFAAMPEAIGGSGIWIRSGLAAAAAVICFTALWL